MKKILALAAFAAFVGAAQAATLSWSAANIYQPGSTTEKLSGGLVCLFITEQSKDFGAGTTTVNDVTKALDDGVELVKNEGKVTGIKSGSTTIDVAAAGSTTDGRIASSATGYYGSFGSGDSLKAFAVIFDSSTPSKYIVTEVKSASWTSSTGAKTLAFGSQADATWKPTPATPVPEPSVALMGLLGLGMMLKRRRA